MTSDAFDDLLAANHKYARLAPTGFDGIAHEGVLVVTCMDSRIEPLSMLGLRVGDAKILRTVGAHLTEDALAGCVVGVHRLNVSRILIIPHTLCAAASLSDAELAASIREMAGVDPGDFVFGADTDQLGRLRSDVERARHHPLIAGRAEVGGFLYDVETGLLSRLA